MVATGLGTDFFQKISLSLTGFLCLVAQSCPSLCDPIECSPAHQAPVSLGISQARILEWLPCPPSGDLPNLGIELGLLHCRPILYQLSYQGKP